MSPSFTLTAAPLNGCQRSEQSNSVACVLHHGCFRELPSSAV